MAKVVRRSNETDQHMLKRFRRKVMKSGVLRDARRKRWFVSDSEKRRIAKKKAERRQRKSQRRKKHYY